MAFLRLASVIFFLRFGMAISFPDLLMIGCYGFDSLSLYLKLEPVVFGLCDLDVDDWGLTGIACVVVLLCGFVPCVLQEYEGGCLAGLGVCEHFTLDDIAKCELVAELLRGCVSLESLVVQFLDDLVTPVRPVLPL